MRICLAFYLIFSFSCVSSPSTSHATEISNDKIQKLKEVLEYGRHREVRLTQERPFSQSWLNQYLKIMHEDMAAEFEIKTELDSVIADQKVAGFLNKSVLASLPQISLDYMASYYEFEDAEIVKQRQDLLALSLGEVLEDSTYEFGLDGFMQNACGGPTIFLLVYVPKEKVVHGIDLTPCTES